MHFKGTRVDLHTPKMLIRQPVADLGFSRGGGRIFKKKSKILTTFFLFLGRPNFFELSQSTVLPLFWQNFLRRRQIFEKKNSQKSRFRHFLENFDQKNAFFSARDPPQN